jgi:hypothetical protein
MRPCSAFISPANRTYACMLCLSNLLLYLLLANHEQQQQNKRRNLTSQEELGLLALTPSILANQEQQYQSKRVFTNYVAAYASARKTGAYDSVKSSRYAIKNGQHSLQRRGKRTKKMLGEYKKHKMVSMQSKQSIPWHGQPYSLIPWLWSIALFHHKG